MKTSNVWEIENFDVLKHEAVILLLFIVPNSFSEQLFERFFSHESSISDKIGLISTTSKAIMAILGNQKKVKFFDKLLDKVEQESITQDIPIDGKDAKKSPFEFDIADLYQKNHGNIEEIKVVKEVRYNKSSTVKKHTEKNSSNVTLKNLLVNKENYHKKIVDRLKP